MDCQRLAPNVWWVGEVDPDLRVFDIIMRAEHGTSYNSYLIKGDKATALIETVKEPFFEDYLSRLKQLVDPRQIDYVILNHMEPDHSGSITRLLREAPQAKVVVSKTGEHFIKNILNYQPEELLKMGDGDQLDLGGKTLQFIAAPFLHWPDSMFTYLKEEQFLFGCDFLGAHYADPMMACDLLNADFQNDFKYYYDHIMRPFKRYVIEAINKLDNYPLKLVAPGHGPIIKNEIAKFIDSYRNWSEANPETNRVIIAYLSAYGNTARLAEEIAKGVKAAGVAVELFDLQKISAAELVDKIEGSKGLMVGSPTINGDAVKPVHDLLSSLATINLKGKLGAAFGSYGWSGEAVPVLEGRMSGIKFKVINSTVKPVLIPTPADLENAVAFGQAFGEAVLGKK